MDRIIKENSKLTILLALVGLVFCACGKKTVFDEYVTIPKDGWHKDSMAVFNVEISNAQAIYDLDIKIRNRSDYPNSNLWLFIQVVSPSGVMVQDTLDCVLADERGKWVGSGWGDLFNVNQPYKREVKFVESGKYRFRIIQGMRIEEMNGIHNIGLCVKEVVVNDDDN